MLGGRRQPARRGACLDCRDRYDRHRYRRPCAAPAWLWCGTITRSVRALSFPGALRIAGLLPRAPAERERSRTSAASGRPPAVARARVNVHRRATAGRRRDVASASTSAAVQSFCLRRRRARRVRQYSRGQEAGERAAARQPPAIARLALARRGAGVRRRRLRLHVRSGRCRSTARTPRVQRVDVALPGMPIGDRALLNVAALQVTLASGSDARITQVVREVAFDVFGFPSPTPTVDPDVDLHRDVHSRRRRSPPRPPTARRPRPPPRRRRATATPSADRATTNTRTATPTPTISRDRQPTRQPRAPRDRHIDEHAARRRRRRRSTREQLRTRPARQPIDAGCCAAGARQRLRSGVGRGLRGIPGGSDHEIVSGPFPAAQRYVAAELPVTGSARYLTASLPSRRDTSPTASGRASPTRCRIRRGASAIGSTIPRTVVELFSRRRATRAATSPDTSDRRRSPPRRSAPAPTTPTSRCSIATSPPAASVVPAHERTDSSSASATSRRSRSARRTSASTNAIGIGPRCAGTIIPSRPARRGRAISASSACSQRRRLRTARLVADRGVRPTPASRASISARPIRASTSPTRTG